MNERIQELKQQATEDILGVKVLNAEKFAELIVLECMQIMNKTSQEAKDNFTYMGDDVPTSAHQFAIREHFGVK